MKRLYVAPAARGRKLGELLVTAVIEHASRAGYAEMVLDTVKPLKAAIALYKKHGFRECEPYYENPMADVLYMRLGLTDAIENATQD
jgi:ribosomal protein S18 acetylase RimI-like enzyme